MTSISRVVITDAAGYQWEMRSAGPGLRGASGGGGAGGGNAAVPGSRASLTGMRKPGQQGPFTPPADG